MRRFALLLSLLVIVLVAIVVLVLGAFPPDPQTRQIEKILPNDRFQHGS